MYLVIDIGNSCVKAGVFDSQELLNTLAWEDDSGLPLQNLLKQYPGIVQAIISSVRRQDGGLTEILQNKGIPVMHLDNNTRLPLDNRYRTTSSLGKDRLAAAVGANAHFRGKNILVIDAGTALTIDFVSSGNVYLGGNISPGLSMRFRALNKFTEKLPLLSQTDTKGLLGNDTKSAIQLGVQKGLLFEVDEYINRQKKRYPDLQVIITGGDAGFFEKKLKNAIFVDFNLNLRGLHRILLYNVGR